MIGHHELSGPADAPVLVLGNSLGTTTTLWNGLDLPFRLLRYDHRGHGNSPAPPGPYAIADLAQDVLDLLDHLDLERVAYAGVSLGGMIGMWLAAHTDRISRLTLVCTTAHFPDKSLWDNRIDAVKNHGLESIADKVVDRWFTPHFDQTRKQEFREQLTRVDRHAYAACCEAIRDMDLRPDLHLIKAPTTVVAAAQDEATPPECGRAIAEAVPDAELHVVDGAAHLAGVEAHEAVRRVLARHLGGADVR
ncbi:3-oxoadipate enol-lactonase [Lentzea tibetensis]|uniref:3-oxoadipate enol-lactonase n=1 Tax=Lentzea tibetensis TaxID=2591470 RepID=A0A563ES24_9PSEU|nr:3-oxoadipate enol-lactonase [Lentzea tibetensis]TWP50459.1 3-oxoadipate enol-lactonase [Lentzea tibetensis]